MKKFIKGTFELDKDVINLEEYEDKHKTALEEIIDWANSLDVDVLFGTSDDNAYLIEYKIVGKTASLCKGLLSELRSMLKDEWKKTQSVWQASGDILW